MQRTAMLLSDVEWPTGNAAKAALKVSFLQIDDAVSLIIAPFVSLKSKRLI